MSDTESASSAALLDRQSAVAFGLLLFVLFGRGWLAVATSELLANIVTAIVVVYALVSAANDIRRLRARRR